MLGVKKELNLRSNTAAIDAKGRLFVLSASRNKSSSQIRVKAILLPKISAITNRAK